MKKKEFDIDKIKKTLLKIKELSEKGFEGERQVAIYKLKSLLKKYNLTIHDLSSREKEMEIKYSGKPDAQTVLMQVIWSIKPNVKIFAHDNKKILFVKLNQTEYIEVIEKNKYFYNLYEKERKKFLISFCLKNKLFGSEESDNNSEVKYTPEEICQIHSMSENIIKGNYISAKKMLV